MYRTLKALTGLALWRCGAVRQRGRLRPGAGAAAAAAARDLGLAIGAGLAVGLAALGGGLGPGARGLVGARRHRPQPAGLGQDLHPDDHRSGAHRVAGAAGLADRQRPGRQDRRSDRGRSRPRPTVTRWPSPAASSACPTSASRPCSTRCRRPGAAVANYPFCTIEPNVGVVPVPDPRLDALVKLYKPKSVVRGDGELRRHRRPGARAPPRARAWATSSWPTSARPTPSATWSAASRTPTSSTSRAASIRWATSRPSTPSCASRTWRRVDKRIERAKKALKGPAPKEEKLILELCERLRKGLDAGVPVRAQGLTRRGAGADPRPVPAHREEGLLRRQRRREAAGQRRQRPPRGGAARPRREAGRAGGRRSARRPRRRSPAWTRPIARPSWRAWA